MKTLLKGALVTAVLVAGAQLASAQNIVRVVVDVPFAFTAGPESLPAGSYEIVQTSDTADVLEFRNTETGRAALAPFVTRLADRGETEALVVFDKDAKNSYLSEIHIPGEDGYMLRGAPERHTHVMVKATRKK